MVCAMGFEHLTARSTLSLAPSASVAVQLEGYQLNRVHVYKPYVPNLALGDHGFGGPTGLETTVRTARGARALSRHHGRAC